MVVSGSCFVIALLLICHGSPNRRFHYLQTSDGWAPMYVVDMLLLVESGKWKVEIGNWKMV